VHNEPALLIQQLRNIYNVSIGDFLLANDLLGPIKIFKVNYPDDVEYYKEYDKNFYIMIFINYDDSYNYWNKGRAY